MFCAKCGKELKAGSGFCPYCGVKTGEQEAVPQAQEGTGMLENPAGIGRRTLGALIDLLVLLAIFTLFVVVLGDYGVVREEGASTLQAHLGWASALGMLLVYLLYYVVVEALTGRTLGKWILKTKVVNERGETPSWGQSAARNVVRIVDGLPFLYLVGFIAVLASKRKQRLGDMASKTYVVRG